MANQVEIEDHYDSIGTLHALRLKDEHDGFPDYTCAFFDGDFSKSLKKAQRDKHAWIFENLGLGQDLRGKRILDIGCGWGPILQAVRERGGDALGLTLSRGQEEYCTKSGLEARLLDYKNIDKETIGTFDGIVCIGAFEHFCSVEEYLAGKQESLYREFFSLCKDLLRPKGRLYLQTMTWGLKVPEYASVSLTAPPDSDEAVLARLEKFYPGSWLPSGVQGIQDAASPEFKFMFSNNGRSDYLETLARWYRASRNLLQPRVLPRALRIGLQLLLKSIIDADTRTRLVSLWMKDQTTCFRREIMSHERMFFEKIQ